MVKKINFDPLHIEETIANYFFHFDIMEEKAKTLRRTIADNVRFPSGNHAYKTMQETITGAEEPRRLPDFKILDKALQEHFIQSSLGQEYIRRWQNRRVTWKNDEEMTLAFQQMLHDWMQESGLKKIFERAARNRTQLIAASVDRFIQSNDSREMILGLSQTPSQERIQAAQLAVLQPSTPSDLRMQALRGDYFVRGNGEVDDRADERRNWNIQQTMTARLQETSTILAGSAGIIQYGAAAQIPLNQGRLLIDQPVYLFNPLKGTLKKTG